MILGALEVQGVEALRVGARLNQMKTSALTAT